MTTLGIWLLATGIMVVFSAGAALVGLVAHLSQKHRPQ